MINDSKTDWLRSEDLEADRRAQRHRENRKKVNQLKRDWDDRKVGVLYVSRREDGSLHPVDGATRAAALCELGRGHELVQCQVYEGLTLEDEAFLFTAFNAESDAVTPFDRYHVGLTARVPAWVGVHEAARAAGVRLVSGGTQKLTEPACSAVVVLREILEGHGSSGSRGTYGHPDLEGVARLRQVLDVTLRAWPRDQRALEARVLAAVALVLGHGERVQVERWVGKLREGRIPRQLVQEATVRAAHSDLDQRHELANLLVEAHDHGLQKSSGTRLESFKHS